jgi:DNA-binding transcriptional MerR regulator
MHKLDGKTFRIEEVALKTGMTKRTLRYYEDILLINPVRTSSGYRLYTEEDIETVIRIKEIKESLGFNLNDIKEILQLEQQYKDICDGKTTDLAVIETSLIMMQRQMGLIEQKEITLQRVKIKYKEAFNKLNSILQQYKGDTNNEKGRI